MQRQSLAGQASAGAATIRVGSRLSHLEEHLLHMWSTEQDPEAPNPWASASLFATSLCNRFDRLCARDTVMRYTYSCTSSVLRISLHVFFHLLCHWKAHRVTLIIARVANSREGLEWCAFSKWGARSGMVGAQTSRPITALWTMSRRAAIGHVKRKPLKPLDIHMVVYCREWSVQQLPSTKAYSSFWVFMVGWGAGAPEGFELWYLRCGKTDGSSTLFAGCMQASFPKLSMSVSCVACTRLPEGRFPSLHIVSACSQSAGRLLCSGRRDGRSL